MTDPLFTAEHMVILTSKREIDCLEWAEHIKDNWKSLMRKNTRFLVLAGIHGKCNGQFGDKDEILFLDIKEQIHWLKEDFKEDIINMNIDFHLVNISNHMNSKKNDEQRLVETVKEYNPTIISLAFCYTDVSELNDILRAAGTYSVLIMTQDRHDMTEGKYIFLDKIQKQIIEKVAEDQPNNIFLWGSSGTGKTILLVQALSIKISHCKRMGLPIKVFISTYSLFNDKLMEDLKHKYLKHLTEDANIQFKCLYDICYGKKY